LKRRNFLPTDFLLVSEYLHEVYCLMTLSVTEFTQRMWSISGVSTDRKIVKYWENNLFQCHFVHHKYHTH